MKSVAGVFTTRDLAVGAIEQLRTIGVDSDHINMLSPGNPDAQIGAVPTTEGEEPGMGQALGAVVGGASGTALGAAAASLLIPGIGLIAAAGFVAVALLGGAAGAVAGASAGEKLEGELDLGLPKDEVFVYEDALRKGRTVLIVMVEDDLADRARGVLSEAGAESVDAAREQWWEEMRDAAEREYKVAGKEFAEHEALYRRGFESALGYDYRGRSYEEVSGSLQHRYPEQYTDEAFKQGYTSGSEYYKRSREARNDR